MTEATPAPCEKALADLRQRQGCHRDLGPGLSDTSLIPGAILVAALTLQYRHDPARGILPARDPV